MTLSRSNIGRSGFKKRGGNSFMEHHQFPEMLFALGSSDGAATKKETDSG